MLEEYMISIGHTEEEINLIKSSYPLNTYTESTFLYKYKNLVNYFHRNGIDNESIRKITTTIPTTISLSIEDIKDKVNEFGNYSLSKINIYKMIKCYPYILEMSSTRIKNKYQLFQKLRFTIEETNDLLIKKPDILNREPSIIEKRINDLINYGYDPNDIPSIINSLPSLIDMNINTIYKKQKELKSLGLNKAEIIRVTTYLPNIYNEDIQEIQSKLDFMTKNEYSLQDIITIIKKVPIILKKQNLEGIESAINNLILLGFSQNDIHYITTTNPYILLYSKDIINENFKVFNKYNYYNSEIIRMIIKTPILLTYNTKELKRRLDYYKDNNCLEIIKNNSNYLLISMDITSKRKKYIDSNLNDLFISDFEFNKKYKITKEELLEDK